MAVNEQIVTGRKFRKLIDEANKIWQRISFWTKSSDVEFEDGKNAETKLGAINGITSDLSCEESTIAASAAALNQVNRSFSDACNTIKAAITGKGVTPSSSKPADLADAINRIQSKGKLTQIATINYSDNKLSNNITKTVNAKSYANYKSLTINNFLILYFPVAVVSGYTYGGNSVNVSKKSYDASTGILTLSINEGLNAGNSDALTVSASIPVYIFE